MRTIHLTDGEKSLLLWLHEGGSTESALEAAEANESVRAHLYTGPVNSLERRGLVVVRDLKHELSPFGHEVAASILAGDGDDRRVW